MHSGSQPLGQAFRPIREIGLDVKRFAKESLNVAPSRLSEPPVVVIRFTHLLSGEV